MQLYDYVAGVSFPLAQAKQRHTRRFASLRLLVALEGMLHLHPGRRIAALAVEAALCSIAVEKALGASDIPGHRIEGIDHLEAEALGLVGLGDADFLDVAYTCAVPDAARVRGVRNALGMDGWTYNFFSTTTAPVPTMRPACSITT